MGGGGGGDDLIPPHPRRAKMPGGEYHLANTSPQGVTMPLLD